MQAFFLGISFSFFGKARGAKPPITFCELPRAADRTTYLVELRSGAPRARASRSTDDLKPRPSGVFVFLPVLRMSQMGHSLSICFVLASYNVCSTPKADIRFQHNIRRDGPIPEVGGYAIRLLR